MLFHLQTSYLVRYYYYNIYNDFYKITRNISYFIIIISYIAIWFVLYKPTTLASAII